MTKKKIFSYTVLALIILMCGNTAYGETKFIQVIVDNSAMVLDGRAYIKIIGEDFKTKENLLAYQDFVQKFQFELGKAHKRERNKTVIGVISALDGRGLRTIYTDVSTRFARQARQGEKEKAASPVMSTLFGEEAGKGCPMITKAINLAILNKKTTLNDKTMKKFDKNILYIITSGGTIKECTNLPNDSTVEEDDFVVLPEDIESIKRASTEFDAISIQYLAPKHLGSLFNALPKNKRIYLSGQGSKVRIISNLDN